MPDYREGGVEQGCGHRATPQHGHRKVNIVSRRLSRTGIAALIAALTATAVLAPSAASAAPAQGSPVLAHDGPHPCVITGGELSWGVKESFRAYISGSIANGSWEASDGASYETPLFSWSNPSGEIDAETGQGSVTFTGTVHFSGHGGVLDLTLANPTLELLGDGTARLRLDAKSNNAQGELVVDEQQVVVGQIEGIPANGLSGDGYAFADAPATLTAEGSTAFSDFYASGDALDPVSLTLQLDGCQGETGDSGEADAATDGETPNSGGGEVTSEPIAAEPAVPWLPIVIGGVALVVILVAATLLIVGRRNRGVGQSHDTE